MDGKLGTFLLGVIAAVVLFCLWDKKRGESFAFPWFDGSQQPQPSPGGCGSSTYAASPAVQAALESTGTAGLIASPGVPLGSTVGGGGLGSFYTNAGVTPDTSFTFMPTSNVPGSPTVPAASVPVRATQNLAPYSTGFHQHYNILGVPVKGYIQ